jgi:hypothetical protein
MDYAQHATLQSMSVISSAVPDFAKNKSLVTGLEWEDPLQVNVLCGTETRKFNLIMTQLAVLLHKRKITLRPYFQDYELVYSMIHTSLCHIYFIFIIGQQGPNKGPRLIGEILCRLRRTSVQSLSRISVGF